MIRNCYVCRKRKKIKLFAKDSSKPFGYSYRCLECEKIRNRKRNKIRRIKYADYYKKYLKKYWKTYVQDSVKILARNRVNSAVKSGKLEKMPCIICGSVKSEKHHPNYLKPLDIIWLCKKHHSEEHQKKV